MKLTMTRLTGLRVRSSYVLPQVPQYSLSQQILQSLEASPDSPAIIDGTTGAETTRGQLADQILRAAGWIHGRIQEGDLVGVSLPNTPLYLASVLGAVHAGGVASLLNPIYTQSEVDHVLGITKPSLVITSPISLNTLKSSSQTVKDFVILGGEEISGTVSFKNLLTSDRLAESVAVDVTKTAIMPLSSGTTGLPKVICLTHKNCVTYNTMQMHPMFGTMGIGKNMLSLLPMFHMYGFTMSMYCLLKGGCFTTLPRFELESVLQSIQKYHVTHVPVVPPIAAALAKHPALTNYNLSSVEEILCGAAPLSVNIQTVLSERLPGVRMRNGYGLSEIVAAAIAPHPDKSEEIMRKGGIGEPLPGIEIRIVDTLTGADLGHNEDGEILIKADTVMKGYLGDAGSTAATVDAEGWLHTGDIGHYDDKNFFYITDRLKELIKYKGWQIAPGELENILHTHPAVADVGVLGVNSTQEGDGEVPKAFIVLKAGVEPGPAIEEELHRLVEAELSSYKKLRGGISFIKQLPRSLAGKLLRRELKKL